MSLLVLFQGPLVPSVPPPPVVFGPFGHGTAAIAALTGRATEIAPLAGTETDIRPGHGRRTRID